jgi:hypothetical protein
MAVAQAQTANSGLAGGERREVCSEEVVVVSIAVRGINLYRLLSYY